MKILRAVVGLILLVLLASCAPAAPTLVATEAPAASPEPLSTSTETATLAPVETSTSEPFVVQLTPVPTDTPLPTLELPTLASNPPALQIWDGVPTYPADSKPDFYFRLRFNPDLWALTADNFGFPALAHRTITDCMLSASSAHNLPLNGTAEHETRRIGAVNFDINTAYVNGVKQFVNYSGGDGNIFTGFELSFQDQPDQCMTDAEAVLATLVSVSASQATPAPTP